MQVTGFDTVCIDRAVAAGGVLRCLNKLHSTADHHTQLPYISHTCGVLWRLVPHDSNKCWYNGPLTSVGSSTRQCRAGRLHRSAVLSLTPTDQHGRAEPTRPWVMQPEPTAAVLRHAPRAIRKGRERG